jgi:ADP-heptose:LPS heptosyltransferase
LIERASLVISNDSGPMHIAAAMGRPLVALFGPTNPVRTGPYGRMDSVLQLDIPCSPCYSRKCSHQSCLRWLTVESVLQAAGKELARPDASSRVEQVVVAGT